MTKLLQNRRICAVMADWMPFLLLAAVLGLAAPARAQTLFTYAGTGGSWTTGPWTKSGTVTAATYPGQIAGQNHQVVFGPGTPTTIALDVNITNTSITRLGITSEGRLDLAGFTLNVAGTAGTSGSGGDVVFSGGTLFVSGAYGVDSTFSTAYGLLYAGAGVASTFTAPNLKLVTTASGAQSVSPLGTLGSLQIGGATTGTLATSVALSDSLIINGTFTHTAGRTLTHTGHSIAGTGNATFAHLALNNASAKTVSGAAAHSIVGNVANAGGTLTYTGGRVTFNGGAAQTISGTGAVVFNALTVTGAGTAVTFSTHITVSSTANGTNPNGTDAALGIATTASTLTGAATYNLYIGGVNSSIVSNDKLSVAGATVIAANGVNLVTPTTFGTLQLNSGITFSPAVKVKIFYNLSGNAGSTYNQTADTTRFFGGGQGLSVPNTTFNHVKFLGNATKSLSSGFTSTGDVYIQSGVTVACAGQSVTIGGNYANGGTFSGTGSQVTTFNGTAAQQMSGGATFRRLVISNTTAAVTSLSAVTASNSVALNGNTILDIGTYTGQNFTSCTGTGTLRLSAASGGNTAFPAGNFSAFLDTTGGTVEYNGAVSYNIAAVPAQDYNNIVISGTGTRTLTAGVYMQGDLTIKSGVTLNGGTVNLSLKRGNFINAGTFLGGNNGDFAFTCASHAQTISGTGSFSFEQLRIANSGQTVSMFSPISVNKKINFETDGILDLGTADLTLTPSAIVITNTVFGPACMLRQNGTAATGAVIITGNNTADFVGIIPIGTGSLYTPCNFTALSATVATGATLAVKVIPFTTALNNILKRYWRFTSSGITAVTDARFTFKYSATEVVGTPNQVVRADAGGMEYNPNGDFYDGVSTFGINTAGNTWIDRDWYFKKPDFSVIYYSYKTGNYSDPTVWTTNYTLATWDNPPDAGGPDANDKIVIMPGKTVTVDVNNTGVDSVHIRALGILDLGTTTGHSWATPGAWTNVNGQGLLRCATGSLPASASWGTLVQAGGGTIEYYGAGTTLDAMLNNYCNLLLSGSATKTLTATSTRTVTVAGTFTINNTVRFVLGSAAFAITMPITGDVTVASGASWRVGNYNVGHTVRMGGNFTSAGDVRFHNLAAPIIASYYTTLTTTGYATVELINAGGATLALSGQECAFYYLRINKASMADAVTISPTRRGYFTIYGNNNQADAGINSNATLCTKALRPDVGTLIIDDSARIPSLTEGGGMFRIGASAELYIRGYVNISTTATGVYSSEIAPYGRLRISVKSGGQPGILDGGTSIGVRVLGAGQFIMDGGSANIGQLCTYQGAGLGNTAVFTMNSGTLTLGATGATDNKFARFDMLWSGSTTTLLGGTINVYNPVGTAVATEIKNGGVRINSNTTTSTGVTWNLYLGAVATANQNFGINTNCNLWRVNMYNQGTYTTYEFLQTALYYNDNGSSGTINIRSLTINTDLVQNAYASYNTGGQNFTLGGNWTTAATAGYNPGATLTQVTKAGGGGSTLAGQATTQTWTFNHTTPTFNILQFDNALTGSTMTLAGNDISCNGDVRFYNAAFYHNSVNVSVYGNVDFKVTHYGPGRVIMAGTASTFIYTNGKPWDLEIRKTATSGIYPAVTLNNNSPTVQNKLILTSGYLETNGYTLTVGQSGTAGIIEGTAGGTATTAFGTTNMVTNNGGGYLQRWFSSASRSQVYPLGTGTGPGGNLKYRPVQSSVTSATGYGSLSYRAVGNQHPNITVPPATTNDALNYYWKTGYSNWSGQVGLVQNFYYNAADIPPSGNANDDANYVIGYYNTTPPAFWTDEVANAAICTYTTKASDYFGVTILFSGDVTVGNIASFGGIIEFWSIATGNWDNNTTWRRKQTGVWIDAVNAPAGVLPGPSNPVVIWASSGTATVTVRPVTGAINVANLTIKSGHTLDLDTTLTYAHNFGTYLANASAGQEGTLKIAYGKQGVRYPMGINSSFFSNGTTVFYRKGYNYQIFNNISTYYYLTIAPDGGSIAWPDVAVSVTKNFIINNTVAGSVPVTAAATGDVIINGSTTISTAGTLIFPSTIGRNWGNYGSMSISGKVTTDTLAGNNVWHTITVKGDVTVTGTLDMQPGSNGVARGSLTAINNSNNYLQGAAVLVRLANITLNKNSGNSFEVTASNFTLKGDGSQLTAKKPITLTGGILRINTPCVVTIHSGLNNTNDFKIPNNTMLELYQGSYYVTATGTNAGVTLEGTLRLKAGTKLKISSATGTDSYLQQSTAAGTPTLEMAGDSLIVGGQFRSQTSGTARAGNFTFSAGVVYVGYTGAAVNTKPSFEIPAASTAVFSGSKIIVGRASGFNPEIYSGATVNSCTGGTLQVGSDVTPSASAFRINVPSGLLYHLYLCGTTAGAVKPTLSTATALTLQGNLTTDAGTVLTMNSLDLAIAGNFTANGTYTPGVQTTTFNSPNADQTLAGTGFTSVTNFIFNPALNTTQLTLAGGNIAVSSALTINRGTLVAGNRTVTVSGPVTNYGTHTSTTGSLILNGSSQQTLTNGLTATYGAITLSNAAGAKSIGNMTLTGNLTLTSGVLDMDTSGLYLGQGAGMTYTGAGFSGSKCIHTAGRVQDQGITKSIASGTFSIVFPLGTGASAPYSYTPATYNATANTAAGNITVKAVNGAHPATTDPSAKELSYYWSVSASGFAGLALTQSYAYLQTMQNGRGNEAVYITARYVGTWQTGIGTLDAAGNILNVSSSAQLSGDYTAGEFTEFSNGATYLSNGTGGGNWEVAASWLGNVVPPTNAQIRIQKSDVITATANGKTQTTVTIDTLATLQLANTISHDLGAVYGMGTLSLSSVNFPAGNFGSFSSSTGGTVEYTGSGYTITSLRSIYNNLRFKATGIIDMANVATTLNGGLSVTQGTFRNLNNKKLVVRGPVLVGSGATFIAGSATTNENLEMYGDFTNNGTFTAGNTVGIFRGSTQQTIGGSNKPYFTWLQINKPAGSAVLTQSITVGKQMTLTQGRLRLRRSNLEVWDTTFFKPDAITVASYVDARMTGRIVKYLTQTTSVGIPNQTIYPVGDSLYYSPLVMNVNSISIAPSGYIGVNVAVPEHPARMNPTRYLKRYWRVNGTNVSGQNLDLTYTYPASSELVDTYPVDPRPITASRYDGAEWSTSNPYSASSLTFSFTGTTVFGDYTGGTGMGDDVALSVSQSGLTAKAEADGIRLSWVTLSEASNDGFALERSHDGQTFAQIGYVITKAPGGNSTERLSYNYVDQKPLPGLNYYRLVEHDRNGASKTGRATQALWQTGTAGSATLAASPNPGSAQTVSLAFSGLGNNPAALLVADLAGKPYIQTTITGADAGRLALKDLTVLPPGLYLARLKTEGGVLQTRFVVR